MQKIFNSYQELHDYFSDIQDVLPKIKEEIWYSGQYWLTLAQNGILTFPIKVVHSSPNDESMPDFIISTSGLTNELDITNALELTNATQSSFKKARSNNSDKAFFMFRKKGYITNAGGDISAESVCAKSILTGVNKKITKLPKYHLKDPTIIDCDLLLYEDLDCPPYLDKLFEMVTKDLAALDSGFRFISVISSGMLLYAVNTSQAKILEIPTKFTPPPTVVPA